MSAPLFRARGLRKRFGGVLAIDDVSFTIPAESVFAIIGPNGAGKSTLLNLLSGIYPPERGTMEFADTALVGLPAHSRVRLGMARTFQKIRLFKQLSALENVLAGFHTRHRVPWWQHVLPGAALWRDQAHCHVEALRLLGFVGLSDRVMARAAINRLTRPILSGVRIATSFRRSATAPSVLPRRGSTRSGPRW